ncbi:homoserine dehydrogenase [Candidatus Marinamargulisbacteria bacterium SCGC AAA071-K20]|nr:homoserine dehydrogenase [Candidatus Marinamargulisbacteria bacterium SCGC AAA071-K20]
MINIGLIGLGNVGKGVQDIISENQALLEERIGQKIRIKTVLIRNIEKYTPLVKPGTKLTTNFDDLINDDEISIIVELIGGIDPAYDYICKSLEHGKFVVTANKEVVSKHKSTFFKLAKENNVDIYFEAAVAGGIPIIRSLKVGYSANKIQSLYGILNGTTNYILTKIEENQAEFKDVLKKAQELGLAEADPTMDVAGTDAAHKLVILAAVAFKVDIQLEDLYYEGIENISLKDIKYAEELDYCIKLLAIGKRFDNGKMSFKVHPTMIPKSHLLSGIKNEFNAVYITGNAVGESMLTGKGAGGSPTGSAVISDIIDIAFDSTNKTSRRNLETNLNKVELIPVEDTSSQFFIRLEVEDSSNVLEKISGTLGANNISILKILQKETKDNLASLVIVTHMTKEKDLNTAISYLKDSKEVKEVSSVIRVRLEEN